MKLPSLRPREITRILNKAGFIEVRSAGSHRIFSHPNCEQNVAVPFHNRDLKMGTLRGIIKQSGMKPEEFIRLR
ncbi:type II toxin-antitoxin system HicA family toxin [Candidatus Collierbacteria bacterium]|nr:type II toxin-antitoxin system HicA family toxin [Candidatus Collierbacteria bacterium]